MNRHYFLVATLAMSLLFLISCKKDDVEVEDPSLVSGTITGEHAEWSEVGVSFDLGKTWADSVKISDKKFSIKLPIPMAEYLEDVESMILDKITDAIRVSDLTIPEVLIIPLRNKIAEVIKIDNKEAKGRAASFYVRKDDLKELLSLIYVEPLDLSTSTVNYMYVSNDLNISGEFNETIEVENVKMPTEFSLDLLLKKGWNNAHFAIGTTTSGIFKISVTADKEIPMIALWKVVPVK
ncbi:MAG: hypothetical protein FWH18_07730 [Marinilabiliaceae bacterium]|nr:hypothetical protein [Marinilabiliaceae bacterium]